MDAHVIFKLNDTDLQLKDSDVIEANYSFLNSSLSAKQIYDPTLYFGEYLKAYSNAYRTVHGYLSFIICVFGIIANIMNITVLTRKNMVSSINAILTGLAVADMLLMFSYLPYAYHNYIRDISEKERYSYEWAIFYLFHRHYTLITHTISTWLTVTVAVWRYIAVSFPLKSASWCSMTRAKYAITATYITCAVFYIPNYITITISEFKRKNGEIIYVVINRKMLLPKGIIFLIFSVFIKFVPGVVLTVLSLGVIRVLNEARTERKILKNGDESNKSQTEHDRTTKMLLAVVSLFLLTQFPQGLIVLLNACLRTEFVRNVFVNLGDTMDLLCLINSSINFIIYCTMSRKFRDTFSSLFLPKFIHQQEIVPIAKPPKTCNVMCRGQSYKIRQIL